jgi:flagellar FliJ protein
MRPFVFRWQRMHRLSEGFEKDRRNALGMALASLARAEERLERLKGRLEELRRRRFELLSRGADIAEVHDNYTGEVEVGLRIDAQLNVVDECEKVVAKRREELTERMRERKTYDKLRERALDEYRGEAKRDEMRMVDDIATIAFGRAKDGEDGESNAG